MGLLWEPDGVICVKYLEQYLVCMSGIGYNYGSHCVYANSMGS